MLRKRSRPVQKDQSKGFLMSHPTSGSCFPSDGMLKRTSCGSFLNVHGHLVGFSNKKGLSESATVWGHASPLDKVLSSITRSTTGIIDGRLRCWDSRRVGLGLVDTLNDEAKPCVKVLGSSESRNIVFGSQMRLNFSTPKSHQIGPRDDPLGAAPQIGSSKPRSVCSEMAIELKGSKLVHEEYGLLRSCSVDTGGFSLLLTKSIGNNRKSNSEVLQSESMDILDSPPLAKEDTNFDKISGSLPISFGSSHRFIGSLSASEIEQSEDYTCIISHGPNPRMTHIFGDCILESHSIESPKIKNKHRKEDEGSAWLSEPSEEMLSCFLNDSLSFCFSCRTKVEDDGKDICMHRGKKALCGCECCRNGTLLEEMEKTRNISSGSPGSSFHEETFLE
ncbi:FCS-Like Zinc finger 10-like [Musa acuminata AAA Group]|uniref:FCS-Like Zinc finger 10-like n=1 Tax=Musa acuminata AAA Group TaxID=214697 RepID=UPI0031E0AF0D